MKARYILAVFCGMLLCEAFLSAQTEEFRFKLYMESLSTGKKDTLELGVGPNGIVGCDYDSALCPVYTDPFFDTMNHIGAFIVDEYMLYSLYRGDTIRVNCPMYLKKRIGKLGVDMNILIPLNECPIRFSWDQSLLQDASVQIPVLTNWIPGYRPDVGQGYYWRPFYVDMSKQSSLEFNFFDKPGATVDSLIYFVYVQDSSMREHAYVYVIVCLGEPDWLTNQRGKAPQELRIIPNPARNTFVWESDALIHSWQVYSVSGKLVCSGRGTDREIDCHQWSPGVYIWRGFDATKAVRCHTRIIKL